MNTPTIARLCHEVNRAYCQTIGDFSQPSWEEAPDWQKTSAINGVLHVIENPDATQSDSHASWYVEKSRNGWKYGPVKDPIKKEHPCMVPYADLPPEQRAKDTLFLAVVRACLSMKDEP